MTGGPDTRGFNYPLQALMMRRQWAIDRTQGQVASARSLCQDLQRACASTRQACESQASKASEAWTSTPDPTSHQHMLGYLAGLRAKQFGLQRQVETALERIEELERVLTRQRISLGTLEAHCDELRTEYRVEQQRTADAQADGQWLTLSAWRDRQGHGA